MRNEINIADEFAAMVAAKVVDILEERGLVMAADASCQKDAQPQPTTLYSIDDVCQRLKISPATFKRHRERGYISPTCYVGRSPRFSEADIEKYLSHFNSG